MSEQLNDERIFRFVDSNGDDHLVKRDSNIESSVIPFSLPANSNPLGFILLDSFSMAQDHEFATFVDIMTGERFRIATNRLCPYSSAG